MPSRTPASERIPGSLQWGPVDWSLRPRIVVVAMATWLAAIDVVPAAAQGPAQWKAALSRQGIEPSLLYQGDVAANLTGGKRRGTTYLGNFRPRVALDGGPLLGVPGLSAFLEGLWVHGGQLSHFAGDAQGVSNIAAPGGVEPYEAWLEYSLGAAPVSALVGLYDLNSEFYRLQSSSLFLDSSFGVGPEFGLSGKGGPSIFPDTSLAARLTYEPTERVVLRGAVLEGVPLHRPDGSWGAFEAGDGLLMVGEVAVRDRPGTSAAPRSERRRIGREAAEPPYDEKLAVGGWFYTARFDDLSEVQADGSPKRHRGSGGAYLIADGLLYRSDRDPSRRLTAFLQAGIGDDRVDRFGGYLGSGLTATDFIPGRSGDEMGLAVAAAFNGSHYEDAQRRAGRAVKGPEIVIELTFLAQVAPWLAVQPDLQYVVDPGSDPPLHDALVFQLEFEVAL